MHNYVKLALQIIMTISRHLVTFSYQASCSSIVILVPPLLSDLFSQNKINKHKRKVEFKCKAQQKGLCNYNHLNLLLDVQLRQVRSVWGLTPTQYNIYISYPLPSLTSIPLHCMLSFICWLLFYMQYVKDLQ